MPDNPPKLASSIRVLFFGDIIGKAGRRGLAYQLPLWRAKFAPDLIVANVENIAHGLGIGRASLEEIQKLGVNIFTGGNHILQGKDALKLLADETLPIMRPLNAPASWPGRGFVTKKIGNETNVTVVNLIGQHGMREHFDSPFEAIETFLQKDDVKQNIIIVDMHAETTSEKKAMGYFLDGKTSVVLGTHTHVPTADEQILPQGTGFISDAGMIGAHNSIIGVKIKEALERLATNLPAKFEVEEAGPVEINAVLVDIDKSTKKTVGINRLRNIVDA
ncbi:MAG: YmdB family metallophosphoesterase [Candidatus Niyogibacteria bacterium]|nr:YmdB family metallophosphoesterase [Candidatus Niyogibacteria bacterium]